MLRQPIGTVAPPPNPKTVMPADTAATTDERWIGGMHRPHQGHRAIDPDDGVAEAGERSADSPATTAKLENQSSGR